MRHQERHNTDRIGWLRAAVLGANDGIVSTASLVIGVASAGAESGDVLLAGTAGLVAGAMSMAAGEFVSVSSQADTEAADLERERRELVTDEQHEIEELAGIYVDRGLESELANEVAIQLMAKDALEAHARDELGISSITRARPFQAAWTSALAFGLGAAAPLVTAVIVTPQKTVYWVALTSIGFLILLGVLSAKAGGANVWKAVARVTFWGALAMSVTAGIGAWTGTFA